MRFRLFKIVILSQLLLWYCDSTVFAQQHNGNSDTISENYANRQDNDSVSANARNTDFQYSSTTENCQVLSVCGIPINELLIVLCVLSVLSMLISLFSIIEALKTRNYLSEPKQEEDSTLSKSKKRITETCNRNSNSISELKEKIFSLEKRIQRLESTINSAHNTSNPNVTISNEVQKQKQNISKVAEKENQETKKIKWLKVIDGGKLSIADSAETAYYRAWTNKKGFISFEFCCLRPGKAINNRTSLIEPFCDIQKGNIDPDSAKEIIVKQCGILNDDYSVNTKILIQYN